MPQQPKERKKVKISTTISEMTKCKVFRDLDRPKREFAVQHGKVPQY